MLERVDIILSLPNISICICTGLILIVINYWIKDVIREYIKKYEVIIIMLFIVFLIFVFSEGYNNPDIQKRRIKYINVPSYLDYYYRIIKIYDNGNIKIDILFTLGYTTSGSNILINIIIFSLTYHFIITLYYLLNYPRLLLDIYY